MRSIERRERASRSGHIEWTVGDLTGALTLLNAARIHDMGRVTWYWLETAVFSIIEML